MATHWKKRHGVFACERGHEVHRCACPEHAGERYTLSPLECPVCLAEPAPAVVDYNSPVDMPTRGGESNNRI